MTMIYKQFISFKIHVTSLFFGLCKSFGITWLDVSYFPWIAEYSTSIDSTETPTSLDQSQALVTLFSPGEYTHKSQSKPLCTP